MLYDILVIEDDKLKVIGCLRNNEAEMRITIDGTDISVAIPYFTKAFIIPAMKEALMMMR